MSFLEIIGAITVGLFLLGVAILLLEIVGNIYGGIRGAYRLHAIRTRDGQKRSAHWKIVRLGLRAWTGKRYRDGQGFYWQIGAMKVPVDGRDPIRRERFYGA